MEIARCILPLRDLNALLRTCRQLYGLLNTELYRAHIKRENGFKLHWAAEHGHHHTVQLLLDAAADLGISLSDYTDDALLLSTRNGHADIVDSLLASAEFDVDKSDYRKRTPLSHAAERGHVSIVRSLLSTQRVDPNSIDDTLGCPPLLWAVTEGARVGGEGYLTIIQLLLEGGADIEAMGYDSRSALSLAAGSGAISMVQLLIEKGACLESQWNENIPLTEKQHRTLAAVRILGPYPRHKVFSPLCYAAWSGRDEVVQILLNSGASIDLACVSTESYTRTKRTPLACAADNGHESTVKTLLDRGANIETPEKDVQSALSCAAEHGHMNVIELLLSRGACPASQGLRYSNPLYFAAASRNIEVFEFLFVQMTLHDGRSPEEESRRPIECKHEMTMAEMAFHALQMAINMRKIEMVRLLLGVPGIDTILNDSNLPYEPLLKALGRIPDNTEIIKLLIAAEKASINKEYVNGWTALDYAYSYCKREEIIQLLLDAGAQRGKNKKGRPPFH